MNKQEIQDELQRHLQAVEKLQAKLKEPEKWKPKGGDFIVFMGGATGGFYEMHDKDMDSDKGLNRAKTEAEAEALAQHLTNQAILWQLANDLNDGWVADWSNQREAKFQFSFDHQSKTWSFRKFYISNFQSLVFNKESAEKAIEILNNQDIGIKI